MPEGFREVFPPPAGRAAAGGEGSANNPRLGVSVALAGGAARPSERALVSPRRQLRRKVGLH
jgi:hypothetical protein